MVCDCHLWFGGKMILNSLSKTGKYFILTFLSLTTADGQLYLSVLHPHLTLVPKGFELLSQKSQSLLEPLQINKSMLCIPCRQTGIHRPQRLCPVQVWFPVMFRLQSEVDLSGSTDGRDPYDMTSRPRQSAPPISVVQSYNRRCAAPCVFGDDLKFLHFLASLTHCALLNGFKHCCIPFDLRLRFLKSRSWSVQLTSVWQLNVKYVSSSKCHIVGYLAVSVGLVLQWNWFFPAKFKIQGSESVTAVILCETVYLKRTSRWLHNGWRRENIFFLYAWILQVSEAETWPIDSKTTAAFWTLCLPVSQPRPEALEPQ